jgi:DNA-binding MarR family transcriptional regulator
MRTSKVKSKTKLNFDVLSQHLGYLLRRLQVQVFKDIIQTLAAFDVRPAQYSVLVLIGANPGRSQAEIGKALSIERAGVAKMLHELENRGWVRRLPAIDDGRSHALFLTPSGVETLRRIKGFAAQHEARLARRIGRKRREQLMTLLKDFG